MAADEIERFRREIVERTGDIRAGREHHRPGPAARGDEHRRQEGPLRRIDPLRRLRLHAHRRLGRQHRHPHPRRPRLRHPAPLRTGRRPRAPPPVLRSERGRPVQRRICRHARHPLRLHRQARGLAAQPSRARRSTSMRSARIATRWRSVSPRRGLPGRAAGRAAHGEVRPKTRCSNSPPIWSARRSPRTQGIIGEGVGPDGRAPRRHAPLDASCST